MKRPDIHCQYTPDQYYVFPFLLVGALEDEDEHHVGWLLQIGWLGLALNIVFEAD
jgi:hypothetical protein